MNSVAEAAIRSWTLDPALLLLLATTALIYLRGWLQLRRQTPRRFGSSQPIFFFSGLACIFLAVCSPLDAFANLLLTAHMIQHLLLMMTAPPLILLGNPLLPLLRGLPTSISKHGVGPFLSWKVLESFGRRLTHPLVCWFAFVSATVVWHVPPMYELALRSQSVHELEHTCFLATGLLFWWPVIQPWPSRAQWPLWAMIPYLFLADFQNTGLSAYLIFCDRVVYPTYAAAPRLPGMSALQDQVAAGAIMWVPGSLVFLIAVGLISVKASARHPSVKPTGNIVKSQPGLKFWAGERYYRRQHIDIDDFYPLDMSGYGAGIEDLNVRVGQLAVAYLGGARQDILTENGRYAKNNFDVRLYDVNAPLGKLGFWYNFATTKGGTLENGTVVPTITGQAFGFGHFRAETLGGYNRFSFQYGRGAASNFSTSLDTPTSFLKDSSTLLLTEHFLIQPNERFSIMPIFIYQRHKSGRKQDGTDEWISFGARPVYSFSEHLSIAFEPGFDHTDSGSGLYSGWLRKFTIAPQIAAGRDFFSRPVLRAFITYANWSDGFRGFVGGTPYRNKTSGITYGVQTEIWW